MRASEAKLRVPVEVVTLTRSDQDESVTVERSNEPAGGTPRGTPLIGS